jgi:hypothetical protein
LDNCAALGQPDWLCSVGRISNHISAKIIPVVELSIGALKFVPNFGGGLCAIGKVDDVNL